MRVTEKIKNALKARGIEEFYGVHGVNISDLAAFEPPCSIKWLYIVGNFRMGAFSYGVSGYMQHTTIGRYVSIGESVQFGRASHALNWVSTSPFFYLKDKMFAIGTEFIDSEAYHAYERDRPPDGTSATKDKMIIIGNDVWIGHGAFVMPGVRVGDGAVIAAGAVVTKDVPPYCVVAGVPAVVKKIRHPTKIAAELLELEWWQYAPWDLKGLTPWDPQAFVDGLRQRKDKLTRYAPTLVSLASLAQEETI